MPIGLLGATLIGAGISGIGSIIRNRMNRKSADRTHDKDIELMKYQNEYNSPSAQVKRLEAARLNPALVYGSGTVAGNVSGNMPKYQESEKELDLSGANEMVNNIGKYQQIRQSQATIDKYYQDVQASKVMLAGQAIKNDILATQAMRDKFEFAELNKLAPHNLDIAISNAEKASISVQNLLDTGESIRSGTRLKNSELKTKILQRNLLTAQIAGVYKNNAKTQEILNLMRRGTMPNDPLWQRAAAAILEKLGISVTEIPEILKSGNIGKYSDDNLKDDSNESW